MIKNRISYAFFLLCAFFFYVFYAHHLSFYFFLFFFLLPILTGILALLSLPGIKIEAFFDRLSVQRGEPLIIEIQARRKFAFFPLQLRSKITVINEMIGETEKEVILIPLGWGKQSAEMRIRGNKCGELMIFFKQVAVLDALGLFAFPVKFSGRKQESAWILPMIIPMEKPEEKMTNMVGNNDMAALRPGNEVPEIYDYRAYQPGDRPSRIHWKLSSKTDEQIWIKLYSAAVPQTKVIVDLIAGEMVDPLLDVAASLGLLFLEKNEPCTFLWPSTLGGQSARIEDEESYQTVFHEILSTPFPDRSAGLPEMAQEGATGFIICITSRANQKMLRYLSNNYEGAGITVLQVDLHENENADLFSQAESLGIDLQMMRVDASLERKEENIV